ncbi:MAG: M20 family metallopeptidase [Bacteroidota bacterium]|nr:M20 family metallopeptidase [Bacteroidota bacterium]
MINKVKGLASQYFEEVRNIRRYLHQHPELSSEEYNTSKFISEKLTEYGINFKGGIAKTGILASIEGKNPSKKIIALRADMDALPISEENNVEYKSVNEGVMHACGHDSHVAILLGCAKILSSLKNEFEGTIKLIFQPSEEKFPGGAITMINEGILDNPKPQSIIAMHVYPNLECGKMGVRKGMYMASTDEIYITVKGKGGHAATPSLCIDPILIASHIIVSLQQIISRNAPSHIPTVLSFGKIIGQGRTNIIPNEVRIEGTLRTMNESWRSEAQQKINNIAKFTAKGMGGECDVFIDKGYPYLVNEENLTERIKDYSIEYLSKENVEDLELRMTAEDFAYFSQYAPSCLYRLGIANSSKGITSNLHTSTFDIDENSLEKGIGLMAWIAINELSINMVDNC